MTGKKIIGIVLASLMLMAVLPMAALAADGTYCVAGAPGLCGAEWDPAGNPMMLNADGLYEKVFENVPGGSYAFKITDGTWNNSWGNNGGNYTITLTRESKVTILFNADTKEITVDIVPNAGAAEVEFTYTVAGEQSLCGVEWDPSQNKMTKNADGLYEITFESIPAGSYQCKVTVGSWDSDWGGNGPGGNYVVDVAETSNVTIRFNADTKEITYSLSAPGVTPEPTSNVYTVAGDEGLCGTAWDNTAHEMTLNAQSGLYEITFHNVAAGDYGFKVVANSNWNTCWGQDGSNYPINLEADSHVTIRFNAETKEIGVAAEPVQGPSVTGDPLYVAVAVMTASAGAAAFLLSQKKKLL